MLRMMIYEITWNNNSSLRNSKEFNVKIKIEIISNGHSNSENYINKCLKAFISQKSSYVWPNFIIECR